MSCPTSCECDVPHICAVCAKQLGPVWYDDGKNRLFCSNECMQNEALLGTIRAKSYSFRTLEEALTEASEIVAKTGGEPITLTLPDCGNTYCEPDKHHFYTHPPDCLVCGWCGIRITGQTLAALGFVRRKTGYNDRANALADTCQTLRDENTQLHAELSRLKRGKR